MTTAAVAAAMAVAVAAAAPAPVSPKVSPKRGRPAGNFKISKNLSSYTRRLVAVD